jgi:hypothetical protein
MKDAYNHRLRLAESAKQRGIEPTAKLFATTVPTAVRHAMTAKVLVSLYIFTVWLTITPAPLCPDCVIEVWCCGIEASWEI